MDIMSTLTAREREIVSLLMQGKQAREIKACMCIEQSTLRQHLRNARTKAGAKTTIELVAKVAREVGE